MTKIKEEKGHEKEFHDENPCYRQFDNLEDFSKFYIGAMTWIQQCLAAGWEKKAKVTSK